MAGIHASEDLAALSARLPDVHRELLSTFDRLEEHFSDACEVEFTVESARLWILQVRRARASGLGAVRLAVGLVTQPRWAISREEAVARISIEDLALAQQPTFAGEDDMLVSGLGASPGAAVGHVAFRANQALEQSAAGLTVILVRDETSPADARGMQVAGGVLTARGGMVSHAAVVARAWGIPAVVGAPIEVEDDQFRVGGTVVHAGDLISIDGVSGTVTKGARGMVPAAADDDVATILSWADAIAGSGLAAEGASHEVRLQAALDRLAAMADQHPRSEP